MLVIPIYKTKTHFGNLFAKHYFFLNNCQLTIYHFKTGILISINYKIDFRKFDEIGPFRFRELVR